MQEEYEINSKKLEEKIVELDSIKSRNVSLENQVETVSAEVRTLQSRIEDSNSDPNANPNSDQNSNSLGEAERKNLVERAEQAEDRMMSFVTEIEELRQKLDSTQNSLETEMRQLSQANQDIEGLKIKITEADETIQTKDATIKTSMYTYYQ